jgi:hypothetical protein
MLSPRLFHRTLLQVALLLGSFFQEYEQGCVCSHALSDVRARMPSIRSLTLKASLIKRLRGGSDGHESVLGDASMADSEAGSAGWDDQSSSVPEITIPLVSGDKDESASFVAKRGPKILRDATSLKRNTEIRPPVE